jgi:spore coat protein CotF
VSHATDATCGSIVNVLVSGKMKRNKKTSILSVGTASVRRRKPNCQSFHF